MWNLSLTNSSLVMVFNTNGKSYRSVLFSPICLWKTTVDKYDIKSTSKTKAVFNQNLISKSGCLSSSKSTVIARTAIASRS